MPPKVLFKLTSEIKMPQDKVLDQNAILKCNEKNIKTHLRKTVLQKCTFYVLLF